LEERVVKPTRDPLEKLLDTMLTRYLARDGGMTPEQCADAVRFLVKYGAKPEEKRV
jgi:hypothetical protein